MVLRPRNIADLLFMVGVRGQRIWLRFLSVKGYEWSSSGKTGHIPLLPLYSSWRFIAIVIVVVVTFLLS
jgi:hypothetical protein